MRAIVATTLAAGMAAALTAGAPAPAVVATATLASVPLVRFGLPALPAAAVEAALRRGLHHPDRPSFGSGLTRIDDTTFIGVTDRGPNDDHPEVVGHDTGVLFPLPAFVPSMVRFTWSGGPVAIESIVPLRRADGRPITGLPNTVADVRGYERPAAPAPLPLDPGGLDIEGVARLPDGRLLLVDEYGPSLVVVSPDGHVLMRYLPPSRATAGAGYPVRGVVPESCARRRANRGFESVAVSPDGRLAWTILESPVGSRSEARFEASRTIRILEWDVADPLAAHPIALFLLHAAPVDELPTAERQHDIKISDAAWVADGRLLAVERAPARARLVLIDLREATNVLGRKEVDDLSIDAADAPLASWHVTPASREVVFDSRDVPAVDRDKIEGLTLVGDREAVVADDNDFAMGDNQAGTPAKFWRVRWPQPLSSFR